MGRRVRVRAWALPLYPPGFHPVYPPHPPTPPSIHRSVPFGSLCSPHVPSLSSTPNPSGSIPSLTMFAHSSTQRNYPWKIECFLEDLFLGGQSSIILGYRRLSVKSLLVCLFFFFHLKRFNKDNRQNQNDCKRRCH